MTDFLISAAAVVAFFAFVLWLDRDFDPDTHCPRCRQRDCDGYCEGDWL